MKQNIKLLVFDVNMKFQYKVIMSQANTSIIYVQCIAGNTELLADYTYEIQLLLRVTQTLIILPKNISIETVLYHQRPPST